MTKDEMRADIARVLRLDPAEIGDDDDLSDLGLDSLRSMSLMLAWEKAGVAMDFGALAELPTLSHWAAVAARGRDPEAGA